MAIGFQLTPLGLHCAITTARKLAGLLPACETHALPRSSGNCMGRDWAAKTGQPKWRPNAGTSSTEQHRSRSGKAHSWSLIASSLSSWVCWYRSSLTEPLAPTTITSYMGNVVVGTWDMLSQLAIASASLRCMGRSAQSLDCAAIAMQHLWTRMGPNGCLRIS